MPVLATLAVMAWLDLLDGADKPFFNPPLLRESIENALGDSADDKVVYEESLKIVGAFETKLSKYQAAVDRTLDLIIDDSADPNTLAEDVDARLESLDAERQELMLDLIAWRRQLVDLLDEEQWNRVFG